MPSQWHSQDNHNPYSFVPVNEILELEVEAGHQLRTLREVVKALNDERFSETRAWMHEPVDIEGGTLVPGEWYDISVKIYNKPRTWRTCRYEERAIRERLYSPRTTIYTFRRIGSQKTALASVRDPMMPSWRLNGRRDDVTAEQLTLVKPITVHPEILAAMLERETR